MSWRLGLIASHFPSDPPSKEALKLPAEQRVLLRKGEDLRRARQSESLRVRGQRMRYHKVTVVQVTKRPVRGSLETNVFGCRMKK